MRGIYGRGDVLAGALILSFCMSLFILTQVTRSADEAAWSSASAVQLERVGDTTPEAFSTTPTIPCSEQEFSWKGRSGGWFNTIVTSKYTSCAVAMADAYYETNRTTQGRMRSYSSDKTFGVEFPTLANINTFAVPDSHSIVVNSYAYQNYYGQPSGLHIIKDYRLTLTDSRLDSEGNKIVKPAKAFDFELRGSDGKLIPVRTTGLKFSSNGKWMIFKLQYQGKFAWARLNLDTYEVLSFATPIQEQYGVYDTISNDGRYVALYEPMNDLRVYDLEKCSNGVDKLVSQQCAFVELYPQLKTQLGANEVHFRHLEFKGDRNISLLAITKKSGESIWKYGEYKLRYGEEPTANGYLAMGDSFSSGEGAYDYRSQTDFFINDEQYNLCHQSRSSYPYVLNNVIGFEWFGSVACSGAVIKDVDYGSGDEDAYQNDNPQAKGLLGREQNNNIYNSLFPGYREQKNFIKKVPIPPRVITMSTGGNDIGFGDIVEACVNPLKSFINCYHDRNKREFLANHIDDQIKPLTGIFNEIRGQNTRPDFRLYVIGYPQIVSTSGVCGLNVGMTGAERDFAHDLVNYLNEAVRIAAAKAAVRYVDVSSAFTDGITERNYQLCGNQENLAVNGLVLKGTTNKKPDKINYQESYHPNLLGHSLLANAINTATDSLSLAMPTAPSTASLPSESFRVALVGDSERHLGDGRTRYDVSITDTPVVRGSELQYSLSTGWSGAKPGTPATLELHSTPMKLGEVVIGVNGKISGSVAIPADVEPGYHELHVKYKDFFGQNIDQYQIVFVRASDDDYDGDGIINELDPCIMSDQSGVDADKDGVDDACDYEYMENSSEESVKNRNDIVASIIENITVLASYLAETPGGGENSSGVSGANVAKEHLNDDNSAEIPKVQGIATSREENRVDLKEWLSVAGALAAVSTVFLIGSRFLARKMS